MKLNYLIILMFFILNTGYSQTQNVNGIYITNDGKEFVLQDTSYSLALTQNENEDAQDIPYHQSPITQIIYSEGSFDLVHDTIICYDNYKGKFYLRYLNEEYLEVIDFGDYLAKSDTLFIGLKLSSYKVNNHFIPIYIGSWISGRKDGWWRYFTHFDSTKIIIYDNGAIIDSLWMKK